MCLQRNIILLHISVPMLQNYSWKECRPYRIRCWKMSSLLIHPSVKTLGENYLIAFSHPLTGAQPMYTFTTVFVGFSSCAIQSTFYWLRGLMNPVADQYNLRLRIGIYIKKNNPSYNQLTRFCVVGRELAELFSPVDINCFWHFTLISKLVFKAIWI